MAVHRLAGFNSPSDDLIAEYCHRNPTVDELYFKLQKLNLSAAASVLRNHGKLIEILHMYGVDCVRSTILSYCSMCLLFFYYTDMAFMYVKQCLQRPNSYQCRLLGELAKELTMPRQDMVKSRDLTLNIVLKPKF